MTWGDIGERVPDKRQKESSQDVVVNVDAFGQEYQSPAQKANADIHSVNPKPAIKRWLHHEIKRRDENPSPVEIPQREKVE